AKRRTKLRAHDGGPSFSSANRQKKISVSRCPQEMHQSSTGFPHRPKYGNGGHVRTGTEVTETTGTETREATGTETTERTGTHRATEQRRNEPAASLILTVICPHTTL